MSAPKLSTPRNFTPGDTPAEKLKMVKDGLDVIHDIYRYAETGFASIAEDDFDRFKWYGVYRQRPKNSGYFMLRTKIPGGRVTSAQMKVLAGIADDYGHGFGDITTRQTVQYHWLTIDQFPDIFARLAAVGMTTSGACGDDTRNVCGCPVAGIDKNEIIDATGVLAQVNEHLTDNREFSNLPRKYKISISGCRIHCTQPDINCVGVFGLERTVNGKLEKGYGMKVGGGLSSSPHLAKTLPIFMTPEDVLPAVHYASVVYRDHGFRDKRTRARLKFLMADWGPDKYIAKMEEISNRKWQRHSEFQFPVDPESDHLGVQEQKQPGLYYVGVSFAGGRTRGHQLAAMAELSARYAAPGKDEINFTNKQNLILLNIPEKNVDALKKELTDRGFIYEASNFRRGCVSCTGIEFCNLAIAETKNRMIQLVGELERECSFYQDKIRIHFSGCPSSCGQHQVADIGFRGAVTRVNGVPTEAFDMMIGGKLGHDARFNELIKGKVLARDVHKTVGRLLHYYQDNRLADEAFADFTRRVNKDELKAALEEPAAAPVA
ncbi:ferredoxin--nitrite reductase [Verrucomicrobia bacterium LW23]|nr:ferredoxin--nitrite reductase [Verrucomicrobia bacterium LW23]